MRSQEEATTHSPVNCTCRIPPPREDVCTCTEQPLQNGHHELQPATSKGIKPRQLRECDVDYTESDDLQSLEYKIPRIKLKHPLKSATSRRDRDKEYCEMWVRDSISPDAIRECDKEDSCRKCGSIVYATERVEVENNVVYHDRCFRCGQCGIKLTLSNFCTDHRLANDVYCRTHRPFLRTSHVDATSMHISVAKKQPKLNLTSGEIRCPENVARYDATALCIQTVLNTPRVWERPPTYFHTTNIASDIVKGDIIGLKYL